MSKEAKYFSDEEIKQFTLVQAEKYAKNLEWRGDSREWKYVGLGRRGDWVERPGLARYKTKGFPTKFAGQTCSDRRDFLIKRLLKSQQTKWNKDAQAAIEAAEAAKPNVSVDVESTVVVKIKDHRPKGRVFTFQLQSGKLVAKQVQNKGSVGRSICSTEGRFTAQDFEDAILLLEEVDMPKTQVLKRGNAQIKVSAGLELQGSHTISMKRINDVVFITEKDRYGDKYSDDQAWQFKIQDLKDAIAACRKKYKVVEADLPVAEKA